MSCNLAASNVVGNRRAFVTTLFGGGYLKGALALAKSLRIVDSAYPLVACCSGCSLDELTELDKAGVIIQELQEVVPPTSVTELNKRKGRMRWNRTFSKLSLLGLAGYDKIVTVDSDVLFLRNADELFYRPSMSAVVAGRGVHSDWVDLNSGVMVIEPSVGLYGRALEILDSLTKDDLLNYEGLGDQDILTLLNPNWKDSDSLHLPECYNAFQDCLAIYDSSGYLPFGDVKLVHFELTPKPWNYGLYDWARLFRRALKMHSGAELKAVRAYRSLL